MAGTAEGGRKAAKTNKMTYGNTFYVQIGRSGGAAKTSKPKGFATMPKEVVSELGRKGGSTSRRPKNVKVRVIAPDGPQSKLPRSALLPREEEGTLTKWLRKLHLIG